MKCPKCGGKEFKAVDWVATGRQMVRTVTNPLVAAKLVRAIGADDVARCHRCKRCGHRFARCQQCHAKWPTTGREEIGDWVDCPGCDDRVYYIGKFW
ncbi:MAG: hypothetical protein HOV83_28480 [Catenulispora sp.]|nr:hypothetical protein [Catenulispora sp.]